MNVFTLSFLALLILKVAEVTAVSWWVVFSPLIIGFLIFIVMAAVVGSKL